MLRRGNLAVGWSRRRRYGMPQWYGSVPRRGREELLTDRPQSLNWSSHLGTAIEATRHCFRKAVWMCCMSLGELLNINIHLHAPQEPRQNDHLQTLTGPIHFVIRQPLSTRYSNTSDLHHHPAQPEPAKQGPLTTSKQRNKATRARSEKAGRASHSLRKLGSLGSRANTLPTVVISPRSEDDEEISSPAKCLTNETG